MKREVLSSETEVLSGETVFHKIGAMIYWCACNEDIPRDGITT